MIIAAFVAIVLSSRNPIGIYFLFSEDVAGTIMYDFGQLVSLNNQGVAASFCLSSAPFSLSSLQASTLLELLALLLIRLELFPQAINNNEVCY